MVVVVVFMLMLLLMIKLSMIKLMKLTMTMLCLYCRQPENHIPVPPPSTIASNTNTFKSVGGTKRKRQVTEEEAHSMSDRHIAIVSSFVISLISQRASYRYAASDLPIATIGPSHRSSSSSSSSRSSTSSSSSSSSSSSRSSY